MPQIGITTSSNTGCPARSLPSARLGIAKGEMARYGAISQDLYHFSGGGCDGLFGATTKLLVANGGQSSVVTWACGRRLHSFSFVYP